MLSSGLPCYNDPEGEQLPPGITRLMDAHVHVFPDKILSAVRQWFSAHAWKIRYEMSSYDLISFLLDHGVSRVAALQYAHKPGMAEGLNTYMADLVTAFGNRVVGMATVFPGEPGAADILRSAFDRGLSGVKLHAHVQCFDMNSPELDPVYALCEAEKKSLIMHVGREPKSPEYHCDPYELCRAGKLEMVLKAYPDLKICVPHLGFDEVMPYKELITRYENLWLDTAMVLTDYFPGDARGTFSGYRLDRVMYGSDFPNIPYAWDREIKWLDDSDLTRDELDQVFYRTAMDFFNLED